jgi:hypothetical protein
MTTADKDRKGVDRALAKAALHFANQPQRQAEVLLTHRPAAVHDDKHPRYDRDRSRPDDAGERRTTGRPAVALIILTTSGLPDGLADRGNQERLRIDPRRDTRCASPNARRRQTEIATVAPLDFAVMGDAFLAAI